MTLCICAKESMVQQMSGKSFCSSADWLGVHTGPGRRSPRLYLTGQIGLTSSSSASAWLSSAAKFWCTYQQRLFSGGCRHNGEKLERGREQQTFCCLCGNEATDHVSWWWLPDLRSQALQRMEQQNLCRLSGNEPTDHGPPLITPRGTT